MSDWRPEYDKLLRDNFDQGLPRSYEEMAGIINGKFGTDFTRNAAIGRAKRIGLCCLRPRTARTGPKRASTPAQRPDTAIRKAASAPKQVAVSFVPRPDPRPGAVPLLDLAPDGCKWPSGEGPYLFCNEPRFEARPYCAAHVYLAYSTPEPRRQRQ